MESNTIHPIIFGNLNRWIWVVVLLFYSFALFGQKINGMSLASSKYPTLKIDVFEEMQTAAINWVALVPEATLDRSTLKLVPDSKNHWWGHTIPANIEGIRLAKKAGLKVFLKPHIVLGKNIATKQGKALFVNQSSTQKSFKKDKTKGAEWRGTLKAKNEKDWKVLEKSYEAYILKLARVAADFQVDLFSIGTELGGFTAKRPFFWRLLIQKVRKIYSGPLIYCANWDEYQKITFWKELDFIGIDTYFPINRQETPTIQKTIKNWRPIQKRMKRVSKQNKRQILLTEFGYRNVPFAGKRPWTHDKGAARVNDIAQSNLYSAFFQVFWEKPWVAGGFAWKWYRHPTYQRPTSFSVQGKPAMEVLKNWFSKK